MIPMELSKEVYEGIVYTQHKTKLKCFVNPILRKIQFWTMKPFVIASESIKLGGEYYFLGYSFKRVSYVK